MRQPSTLKLIVAVITATLVISSTAYAKPKKDRIKIKKEIKRLDDRISNIELASGPQGDKGETGATGTDGTKGDTGPQGLQGQAGASCTVQIRDGVEGLAALTCPDGSSIDFVIPFCGNGIKDPGEECDTNNFTCTDQCELFTPELFIGSTIVGSNETQVNDWSGMPGQSWTKCYDSDEYGHSAQTFHQECDGVGPTITFVLTSSGKRIGGYNENSWSSNTEFLFANESFLFSLSNQFKHEIYRYNQYASFNNASYGPTFGGGHDLHIRSDGSASCSIGHTYSTRISEYGNVIAKNDFCGTSDFYAKKVEVFYLSAD